MYEDLGDTEIVNKASLRLDQHIDILEKRVDGLEAENKLLRKNLDGTTNSSTVTQEKYDALLKELKQYWDDTIPF